MYSDLDKKSVGGYIIEDALVLSEVFNSAINIRRGQIFYGRQYGTDFEQYLLRLKEPDTLYSLQSELYNIRNMDGRLIVDGSQTTFLGDTEDSQELTIQTALDVQGLGRVSVESLVEPDEGKFLTVQDYIDKVESPWKTIE